MSSYVLLLFVWYTDVFTPSIVACSLCMHCVTEFSLTLYMVYVVRCGGLYPETLSSCNFFCEVDTVTTFSPVHNSIN